MMTQILNSLLAPIQRARIEELNSQLHELRQQVNELELKLARERMKNADRLTRAVKEGFGPKTVEEAIDEWT